MRLLWPSCFRPGLLTGAIVGMGSAFALAYAGSGGHVDAQALVTFQNLQRSEWLDPEYTLVHTVNPAHFAIASVVLPGLAAIRRRPRAAAAMLVGLVGSGASAEVLKHLLAPPGGLDPSSFAPAAFPSGHAAAVMALVLAAEVGAPAAIRPAVAAVGVVFALALGYTLIGLGNHHPSEVVGGFLLAGIWGLIGLRASGCIGRRERRGIRASAPRRGPLLAGATGFAALSVAMVLVVQALQPARSLAPAPLLVIWAMTATAMLSPWMVSRLELGPGDGPGVTRRHELSLP